MTENSKLTRAEKIRHSSTFLYLTKEFGPLMPLEGLAKTLDRSPQGLRVSLHSKTPLSDAINSCKKRIGRRVYFDTVAIAQMIDDENWGQNEQ